MNVRYLSPKVLSTCILQNVKQAQIAKSFAYGAEALIIHDLQSGALGQNRRLNQEFDHQLFYVFVDQFIFTRPHIHD